jgi:hypothetical protein
MDGRAHTLFCFGFGLSAQALARALPADHWRIIGTTRSPEKAEHMAARAIEPVIFDGEGPMDQAGRQLLADATHILVSIPPGDEGDPVIRFHSMDIGVEQGLAWLGYLSTTGVYGDHQGGWVDEDTPIDPDTARGEKRAVAERHWLTHFSAGRLPVHIFRLAGIYGPGRSPLDSIRAGRARRVVKAGQVFSRIHVDDIAQVLQASMEQPNPGRIYNVCDDLAASPQEVLTHAANLLHLPPPPEVAFEDADLSPMARSFYADNKRVRNDRIKDELGIRLKYPTYREGLASLLHATGS